MGFHSPLIRPYLLGGVALGGGTLDSHDILFSPETNIAHENPTFPGKYH